MHSDKYGGSHQDGVMIDMHHAPRFGHTSDFAKLFSSNEVDPKDYKTGVLAFAGLVVLFFFLWAAHLLVLKIRGKERVGCASGQVYQQDATMEADQRATRRESRLRCAFVMCILAILTACAVLLGSAVPTALDATSMLVDLRSTLVPQFRQSVVGLGRMKGSLPAPVDLHDSCIRRL